MAKIVCDLASEGGSVSIRFAVQVLVPGDAPIDPALRQCYAAA